MNDYDSEVIAGIVEDMGYIATGDPKTADLILFNTCCVRENADLKVYGRLWEYKPLKDMNPNLIIGVLGCLAQKDKEEMIKRFPQIDIIASSKRVNELKAMIENVQKNKDKAIYLGTDEAYSEENELIKRKTSYSAYLPISTGCSCYCTFCIVPHVRGKMTSRPIKSIIEDIKKLSEEGYKELFLLGQNVNIYGVDLKPQANFTELLYEIDAVSNFNRIRFTSPHPKNFPDEFIKAFNDIPALCENIHLPLQSGDNSILKLMNRGYTIEEYYEIVEKLRKNIKNVSITTDFIVGFPGEEEQHFENTLNAVRKVQFDSAFMFAYSPRKYTPAFKMQDKLNKEEKLNRLYKLIEIQNNITLEKNRNLMGQILEVLVTGQSWKDINKQKGYSRTNKTVIFSGNLKPGDLAKIKITEGFTWGLKGELI